MIIEFKPFDTLFFRDGKPFNKGAENVAETIFPPFPATIYGALRTAFFDNNISIFQELLKNNGLNSDKDPTRKLKINNVFIKNSASDYLFAKPKNLLTIEEDNKEINSILTNLKSAELSNCPLNVLYNDSDKNYKYASGYLDEISFGDFLNKDYENVSITNMASVFNVEQKVGIAIDQDTNCAKDQNLYRVDYIRLDKDIALQIDFEGFDLPDNFVMKLGGDGKYVACNRVAKSVELPLSKIENRFFSYIHTPAIFKNGWLPEWIDPVSFTGHIPASNIKVKLLSANIGKPLLIGGFDMAKRRPKPMYKAVPAGSLYFFEILSGDSQELQQLHQKSISDIYPEQGFGINYIGKL